MRNSLIKAMRLFVSVLFTTIALSLSAQTQKKISLQMENATVENILNEIERQTDYLFVCESLDMSRRMSVDLKDKSVEEALSHIFDGTGVSWKVTGSNIYLFPKTENKDKVSDIVTGTVLDNFGEPLIGAAVLVKGTTIGAGTDLDGKFEFQLPADLLSSDNVILEFSCLGYKSQEIKLGNKRVFEVKLADDSIMMEGTVVTALGIKRSEKALSYNVQEIKADDLVSNKDANFINSLNGKVAGLNINASSSGVGGATKVIMRGQKSISQSSNALYVIDGVPMYTTAREGGTQFDSQGSTDPIADINPEDIESISVLTGAAAAALYGSDAANGAIVVTTKKGKEGKLIVNASAGVEIMNPFVLPRFQN